jgi:hypothetical protein
LIPVLQSILWVETSEEAIYWWLFIISKRIMTLWSFPHNERLLEFSERDHVLKYLHDKQETEGGYTGNDLTAFAKQLVVTERGLRKRISNWVNNDKEFKQKEIC